VACEAACGVREKVTVYGTDYPTADGTCVRDYIHVEDLARAHLDALRYLEGGGASDTFNCGYGRGYSVRDVLCMVEKVSGVRLRIEEGARRAGDAAELVAEAGKVRRALGWEPRHEELKMICSTAYRWAAVVGANSADFRVGRAGLVGNANLLSKTYFPRLPPRTLRLPSVEPCHTP
jgi:UDP-glucose 4-epimerase